MKYYHIATMLLICLVAACGPQQNPGPERRCVIAQRDRSINVAEHGRTEYQSRRRIAHCSGLGLRHERIVPALGTME